MEKQPKVYWDLSEEGCGLRLRTETAKCETLYFRKYHVQANKGLKGN